MRYYKFLIFILFINSCAKNNCLTEYNKYLNDFYILNNYDNYSIKNVIIVPNEGCGGCISDATSFFKENLKKNSSNTIVIFTGIYDLKQLNLTVGKSFLKEKNVFIDTENIFMNSNIASIYPQILETDNGCVKKASLFDKEKFKVDSK